MMTMYKWDSPALKQIWQKLYADNPYLFPYSSWEYNEQIYKYMKVKPSSMFQKNFFCVYEEEKKAKHQPKLVADYFSLSEKELDQLFLALDDFIGGVTK